MTAEGPVCSVAPFLLAVLISPLILLRPTHMTHYSQIPTLNQLASYASSGEFLTLMTPSEVTLQNALLSVIFNICERGHLAQSDLASLMDAWDGLSHHLELPPPGGSEGGAGATANNGEGSGDGNGDTTANNGEANEQGNGDGNEGEGGNTGEGGNEGENEAGGDDMDVDMRPPLDGDAAAASSSGQKRPLTPSADWSGRLRPSKVVVTYTELRAGTGTSGGSKGKQKAVPQDPQQDPPEDLDDADVDFTFHFNIPAVNDLPSPPSLSTTPPANPPSQTEKVSSFLTVHSDI